MLNAADLHKMLFGNSMGAVNVQFGGDLALMLNEYTDEQRDYCAGQTRCNNPEHSYLRSSNEGNALVLKIWLVLE
jgi:hypothetical protein